MRFCNRGVRFQPVSDRDFQFQELAQSVDAVEVDPGLPDVKHDAIFESARLGLRHQSVPLWT